MGGLAGAASPAIAATQQTTNDRAYMAGLLQKMAEPVLSNMAGGTLQKRFPLEVSPTWDGRDKRVSYLECFGRLIAGVAPWLALPDDGSAEGRTRKRLQQLARLGTRQRLQFDDEMPLRGRSRRAGARQQSGVEQRRDGLGRVHDSPSARSKIGM